MNFHYANLMKSMKKRVKQVKVKGQENKFLALETSNIAQGSKFKTNQYRKIHLQIFDIWCKNVRQMC